MNILLVGAGPKALQALEQLVHQAGERTGVHVHLVDPRRPGTGAAYDPSQPDFLRLNVDPRIIHLPPLPPLTEWTELDADVPRALVGRYLAEGFEALQREARFPIEYHQTEVVRLDPSGSGWRAELSIGDPIEADEVLLATGHATVWDGALSTTWKSRIPLIPAVYPTCRLDQILPGSRVATRGAALTFIDLSLALTEGRERDRWPAKILPTARAGQLLSAKPAPIGDPADDQLPGTPGALLEAIQRLATRLLATVTGKPADPQAIAHTLATGWEPDLGRGDTVTALRRSIEVADGLREPGPAWALGRTWGARYPDVVEALSFSTPDPDEWSAFLRTSAVLERLTFGPPLANARRLLDLCDQGIIDTHWLDHGVRIDADGVHDLPPGASEPDIVVDAVLAPPGAQGARNRLLDQLVNAGHATLAPGQRGLAATPDGRLLPAVRTGPGTGLAALGRPLEDVVIGNDTLSRTLHDTPRWWAARVVERLDAPPSAE